MYSSVNKVYSVNSVFIGLRRLRFSSDADIVRLTNARIIIIIIIIIMIIIISSSSRSSIFNVA